MKNFLVRGLFGATLALASAPAMLASATSVQTLESPLTAFLPPPPSNYQTPMPPNVVEDLNGMEPSVHQAYVPVEPGALGLFGVTLTRPSPADMETAFPDSRPLGAHPMAPWMVTRRVKINELDAYLSYNDQGPGGVLEMKVGRILVAIQGSEVTPDAIIAMARSMDTAGLQKY